MHGYLKWIFVIIISIHKIIVSVLLWYTQHQNLRQKIKFCA